MTETIVLSPHHLSMLESESRINRQVIQVRGYRSIDSADELLRLGFDRYQCKVPGLLIPIWGPSGTEPVSYQFRPDHPRVHKGKAIKYESLPKVPSRIDVPPGTRAKVLDQNMRLWITEGCKKADAAVSFGLCCIDLSGVWNFKAKNDSGSSVVLGDFEHIPLKGREVVICFDSDVMEKPSVQQALMALHRVLLSKAAVPKFCFLPSSNGKVGLDDFLAAGGSVEQLEQMIVSEFPTVRATTLADIQCEEVTWLWRPYFPQGEPTLLAGDGGVGKSYLAMAIAKSITVGEPLPGGILHPPRDVLFVTDEDHVSKTMKPRAMKLGLDESRFHVLDLAEIEGDWLQAVRQNAKRVNAALIVLDPIQSFIGPDRSLNDTSDMRPFMRMMRELATDTNATVLIITHINKMTGGKSHYRVNGSVDIVNASRSALIAGFVDVEGSEICVLGHAKSNYAAKGPSLQYEIDEFGFRWVGPVPVGVEDISTGQRRATKLTEAAEFLQELLKDGPKAQTEIEASAASRGISNATLRRAKSSIGVSSVRTQSGWWWQLASQDAHRSVYDENEHLDEPQVQIGHFERTHPPTDEHLDQAVLVAGVERVVVNQQECLDI